MLEFYEAYRDYRYLMDFTEEMLRALAQGVLGTTQIRYGQHTIDLENRFERLTIEQALQKYATAYARATDPKALALALSLTGVKADPNRASPFSSSKRSRQSRTSSSSRLSSSITRGSVALARRNDSIPSSPTASAVHRRREIAKASPS